MSCEIYRKFDVEKKKMKIKITVETIIHAYRNDTCFESTRRYAELLHNYGTVFILYCVSFGILDKKKKTTRPCG